jgi:hypothetical protein
MARYALSTLLAVAVFSSSAVWAQAPAAATQPPAAADPNADVPAAGAAAVPTAPPAAAAAPATDAPVATPLASKHFDYPAGIVSLPFFLYKSTSFSTILAAIPSRYRPRDSWTSARLQPM